MLNNLLKSIHIQVAVITIGIISIFVAGVSIGVVHEYKISKNADTAQANQVVCAPEPYTDLPASLPIQTIPLK